MNFLDYFSKGQDALLGQPNSYGGMIDEESKKQAQQQARMMLAASLLEAGGPSSQPTSLGQALGRGMMAGQQAQQSSLDSSLKAMLMKQQMAKAAQGGTSPSGVREYEYAKANGYKGSFEEWKRVASAQQQTPAGIQEYEYFNKLSPDQQKQFLSLQRSPVVPQVVTVNGVPTLVDRTTGQSNPLSTQESEADAARRLKEAEAKGAALGKAGGELAAGILKKGNDAKAVEGLLDGADALIDIATGSTAGDVRDRVLKVFGYAPESAQAITELAILQANLMMQQPRMEGPQGVLDVQLYEKMAGEIGNPRVPAAQKKAALRTIRKIQQRYVDRAAGMTDASAAPSNEQARKSVGGKNYVKVNGQWYEDDGT